MGRRLNISQPTVIKTELTPLIDLFDVVPSDTLEQWYYVNSGEYKPNRSVTPLILTPTLQAFDDTTNTAYNPSFANVVWYYLDPSNTTDYSGTDPLWPGRGFVRITAVADGTNVDFYCPTTDNPERHLVVKKNVPPPTGSVGGTTICCVCTYVDPRDAGVTYIVKKEILLATNQDATQATLSIALSCPPSQKYNVFTSSTSVYEITAKVINIDNQDQDVTAQHYIEWYAIVGDSTTEVLLNTLLCYQRATQASGKGQGTDTIRIDAMYVNEISIVARIRKTTSSSSELLPAKAYASIIWDMPKIDAHAVCRNGSAIDSKNRTMVFENVINIKERTLTREEIDAHLLVNWKRRVSTSGTFTDMGWGSEISVESNELINTTSYSTPVHSEIYMRGAYEYVTHNNEIVTHNNEEVWERS